ncbi:MAG: class I SAM-dependent methyltransferase [Flavobacteriales bacterium]
MEKRCSDWFESWFDSPYYKMLYSHRSASEAELFIINLLAHIQLPPGSHVLDLACGRGRHSLQMHKAGYNVLGIDLSKESIAEAKALSQPGLTFEVADMRYFELNQQFDAVMNLFTSFGYFDEMADNTLVLQRIHNHVKTNGLFIMDFFNAVWVQEQMVEKQEIQREHISFHISKHIEDDIMMKSIDFSDNGKEYHFEEHVRLIKPNTLKTMIEEAGFNIVRTFGNYSMSDFDEHSSDRIIIIATK